MSSSRKLASPLLRHIALFASISVGCVQLIGLDDDYHASGASPGAASEASSATTGSTSASSGADTSAGSGATGSGGSDAGGAMLLDDMEDGTQAVALPDGSGALGAKWERWNDGTGTLSAPPDGAPNDALIDLLPKPRGDSHRAVHLAGKDFTKWGSAVGIIADRVWDASAWKGLTFWARTDTPSCDYAVQFSDEYTDPKGGICTACYDDPTKPIHFSLDWVQYSIPFEGLHTAGYGMPPRTSLDTTKIYSLYLGVVQGCPFDVWIDDVGLYR